MSDLVCDRSLTGYAVSDPVCDRSLAGYAHSHRIAISRRCIFNRVSAQLAPDPLREELDIPHAHRSEDQNGIEHQLFEEHLVKIREIAPVRIVIQKDLHGLQKRRERNPCRELPDIPGHHLERPSQPREHDAEHAGQVRERHRDGLRSQQIDAREQRLRERDIDEQRAQSHDGHRLQYDIDPGQAILIHPEAAQQREHKNDQKASEIKEALADAVLAHGFGQRLLIARASHQADEDIEAKEDEDGHEVFAIERQRIERPVDIEPDRLKRAHQLMLGHALFIDRNHAHADRCRLDDCLNGLVGIAREQHVGAIQIGENASAALCLDGLRHPIRNIHDSSGLAISEHIFRFFERIERPQHLQIRPGIEEQAKRPADRAVVVIHDIDRHIRHDAHAIDRHDCHDRQHERGDHEQELRPPEQDRQKI